MPFIHDRDAADRRRVNERVFDQSRDFTGCDPLDSQALQGGGHILPGVVEPALPVFGQIREHRKQHEAAHEGKRIVDAEGFQMLTGAATAHAAIAVDRGRADALDAFEKRHTAIGTYHVAKQATEIADIGILRDRNRRNLHYLLRRKDSNPAGDSTASGQRTQLVTSIRTDSAITPSASKGHLKLAATTPPVSAGSPAVYKRRICSGVSSSFSASTLSAICAILLLAMIGRMAGLCCRIHAMIT